MLKLLLLTTQLAGTVTTQHDLSLRNGSTETGGTKLTTQAINAAKYTGWVYVGDVKQLVLEITYTNSAASDVIMQCHTSLVNTGANGTGAFLPALTRTGTSTAPVETTAPAKWTNPVAGDETWTWLVDNIPQPFINCNFTGTSADANDKVTVKVSGVSP